jgi:hypothetical protein
VADGATAGDATAGDATAGDAGTPPPPNCLPDGAPCAFAEQCCNGFCLPDANGDLVCNPQCVPEGEICTADVDCCDDGICLNGTCQPNYADCLPLGDKCVAPDECCSNVCDTIEGVCTVAGS